MTIEDVKTRWLANRRIADLSTREADLDVLKADIIAEWSPAHVDLALNEATKMITKQQP